MASILLTTLNARYSHCAFGLRYLYANLKELQAKAKIVEFTIAENPRDIAERVLTSDIKIIGFGVYIWNVKQTTEIVSILKLLRPDLKIVVGGPEVSYETESQDITALADLVIQGEGDHLFYSVCKDYLGQGKWPESKILAVQLPDIRSIALPYSFYTDADIKHRVIYVEASRGCPYKCEYCLSSLDKSVRSFDLGLFLDEMNRLIERGVRQFKFVDRTFNLSVSTSVQILKFFLSRVDLGLFLHFEMVPDRLPLELRDLITRFPPGSLQFEIGIQTFDPKVSALVSRRQDLKKVQENFNFLTTQSNVHLHADLIVGLPGETLESFAHGFDELCSYKPHEIQVGILKRLRGTPIVRHDKEWQMTYQASPPYQILQTRTLSFETIQHLARFSRFWDLIANSGNFTKTFEVFKAFALSRPKASVFWAFSEFTSELTARHPQGHGVALVQLVESVWLYFKSLALINSGLDLEKVRMSLIEDYALGPVTRDIPAFLRTHAATKPESGFKSSHSPITSPTPRRQARHHSL